MGTVWIFLLIYSVIGVFFAIVYYYNIRDQKDGFSGRFEFFKNILASVCMIFVWPFLLYVWCKEECEQEIPLSTKADDLEKG